MHSYHGYKTNGKKNLWGAKEIKARIEEEYKGYKNMKVIIIPQIESVNYGRDVGYEIIEWRPPEDIKKISATGIRRKRNSTIKALYFLLKLQSYETKMEYNKKNSRIL